MVELGHEAVIDPVFPSPEEGRSPTDWAAGDYHCLVSGANKTQKLALGIEEFEGLGLTGA